MTHRADSYPCKGCQSYWEVPAPQREGTVLKPLPFAHAQDDGNAICSQQHAKSQVKHIWPSMAEHSVLEGWHDRPVQTEKWHAVREACLQATWRSD